MGEQTWLITGGAGYIGSHIAKEFLSNQKQVLIYDSLSQGLISRIEYLRLKSQKDVPLIIGDIRDVSSLENTLRTHKPFGIIHTAAIKSISESILKPDEYMDVNYFATVKLIELAKRFEVKNMIFSSSAAIYGAPSVTEPVKEDFEASPITAYGESKLLSEIEIAKFLDINGNNGTSLRYFNVIGAASPELADNAKDNLLPKIVTSINEGVPPIIFGTEHPTIDGTCIRDYIDVRDVARAHLVMADYRHKLPVSMNLGTGRGTSVRELMNRVLTISEKNNLVPVEAKARIGDSSVLYADVSLIKQATGFVSEYSLDESIISSLGARHE
jgi:UDP-glucose 4-epimerase